MKERETIIMADTKKRKKAVFAGIFGGLILLLAGAVILFIMLKKTEDDPAKEREAADVSTLLSECTLITEEMYGRATAFPEGDLTRIAVAMRKAEKGEKVTIGVIGGSITEGSLASSGELCYASLLKKWWETTFPEAEIELVNAGIGGTSSYYGVHRLEKDLLCFNPDFIVVEFSVNDANNAFYKKSYDNLIYRILKDENAPGLLLLFMTMEDGTSAQENDSLLGFQYGLPMISYRNAVLEEIEAGHFTWKDISPDNIHPNDRGHAIVGELLSVYLGGIYAKLSDIPEEKAVFDKEIVTKEVYADAEFLNWDDVENVKTETGGSIFFQTEAANIGIMYMKLTDGTGGQFEVYVDGEYQMTLDADFTGGWGNYGETIEVYTSDQKASHEIEIRKKEGSTGDAFRMMGLLIS